MQNSVATEKLIGDKLKSNKFKVLKSSFIMDNFLIVNTLLIDISRRLIRTRYQCKIVLQHFLVQHSVWNLRPKILDENKLFINIICYEHSFKGFMLVCLFVEFLCAVRLHSLLALSPIFNITKQGEMAQKNRIFFIIL